jgi:hypothetical protein
MAFDYTKPTVQMLGRWQPWHEGHTELFKRAHAITGQVIIMVRDVQGASGGDGQDDNPFAFDDVINDISTKLLENGFTINSDYVIIKVPNIVDISYGRGVGYTFTEHDLGKDIHNISATKIREQMRKEGKLDAKH